MNNFFAELKAKYDFWYVKKFFKLDKQYTFFLDLNNPKNLAVKLLGKYEGVIVEFSNIQVSEQSDATISFDTDIIANPNLHNTNSTRFKNYTANVMRSIILASVEYAEKVVENENGNSDLVESDAQRAIHEEDIAISEERVPERKPRKKAVRRSKKVHSEIQQSAADSSTGDQSQRIH
jgi:hypothetical protein